MRQCVYFIQELHTESIKIGNSHQVDRRLRELAAANSQPVDLLGALVGNHSVEKLIHARFAHLNLHNEWFMSGSDLLEFIDAYSFPDQRTASKHDLFDEEITELFRLFIVNPEITDAELAELFEITIETVQDFRQEYDRMVDFHNF